MQGIGALVMLVSIILILLYFFADGFNSPLFGLVAVISIGTIGAVIAVAVAYQRQKNAFLRRPAELMAYAEIHKLQYEPGSPAALKKYFPDISILQLRGAREPELWNVLIGPDWIYGDISYRIYQRTKHGEEHTQTVYYSVVSAEFPRQLPNIFFDSKRARGRQFRFHFAANQFHSLEGDFDKYFATYFPPEYSIDGLSIITPDVMQAMIAASDYDIELRGKRVYMYGPIENAVQQLPELTEKIGAIRKELLDNILTYRDERLPYEFGRSHVSIAGAELKKSKFWTYVGIAMFVIYIIAELGSAFIN
jgi:hypothetical protein